MINIVNTGPHDADDPMGERVYEVRINDNVLCSYKHARRDGLAACLRQAAEAVERHNVEKADQLIRSVHDKSTN